MMRRKLIIGISALIVIVCILSLCSGKKAYEFLNGESEMIAIEIVKLGVYDQEKDEFHEEMIATVEDHSAFLSDFKKVDCDHHWSDPTGVYEGDICIKITYQNGEYELISSSGQGKYRHFENHPSNFDSYAGFRFFNEQEFTELLEKYSGDHLNG